MLHGTCYPSAMELWTFRYGAFSLPQHLTIYHINHSTEHRSFCQSRHQHQLLHGQFWPWHPSCCLSSFKEDHYFLALQVSLFPLLPPSSNVCACWCCGILWNSSLTKGEKVPGHAVPDDAQCGTDAVRQLWIKDKFSSVVHPVSMAAMMWHSLGGAFFMILFISTLWLLTFVHVLFLGVVDAHLKIYDILKTPCCGCINYAANSRRQS